MNCPNCGSPTKEGAVFCPVCGKKIEMNSAPVYRERAVVEKKSMPKGLKVAIIVTSCVLGVGLTAFLIWLGISNGLTPEDVVIEEKAECIECGKELEGEGEYCDTCEEEMNTCKMCEGKFSGETKLCEECLEKADEKYYDGEYVCLVCEQRLEKEEIVLIDSDGKVYCKDCDGEYECAECGDKFLYSEIEYEDEDNRYCKKCFNKIARGKCAECEIAIFDEDDYEKVDKNYYCIDCYDNLSPGSCDECGEKIEINETHYETKEGLCCEDCYAGECDGCQAVLTQDNCKRSGDEIYCNSCAEDNGYIADCEDCGNAIFEDDAYCELEDEYRCGDCYEKNPVECAYCGDEILDGTIYIYDDEYCCEDCY